MATKLGNTCKHGTTRLNVSPEGGGGIRRPSKASHCMIGAPSLGGASTFFFFVLLPLGRPRGRFPGWGGGAASGSPVAVEVVASVRLVGPVEVVPMLPLIAE